LLRTGAENGSALKVLQAVEDANEAQKHLLLEKIRTRFGSNLAGMRFALWGLAFKPNTDDMRAASSRVVIEGLWQMGATVIAYDPVAMAEARRIFGADPRLTYADAPLAALREADALVIVTEWKEFRAPDFDAVKKALKTPLIFDGRNLYQPSLVRGHGIEYFAIGRN
jgi:UDPglucose 6-dehydrogenase